MASSINIFETKLRDLGNMLLNPPISKDQLQFLLNKAESYLLKVEQEPCKSIKDALLPLMEALVADNILKHHDTTLRVSAVNCLGEITRITAPNAPYSDNQMKEIFQLKVASLQNLSNLTSDYYPKVLSILKIVAKYRTCLLMLDLQCDKMIVDMFPQFLNIIRSNQQQEVFCAMETIMTLVLNESEDISVELLSPILTAIREEKKNILPISWRLGEKVVSNCAAKLKPYLIVAVHSLGIPLTDYSPIITTICQSEHCTLQNIHEEYLVGKGSSKDVICSRGVSGTEEESLRSMIRSDASQPRDNNNCIEDSLSRANLLTDDNKPENVLTKKRSWKPKFLVNPKEGYDYCWINTRTRVYRRNYNQINHNISSL